MTVSTEPELQAAVRGLKSNTTIEIAPGTYFLTRTLYIHGPLSNVAIRGTAVDGRQTVLVGAGMTNTDGRVPYGLWTGEGVRGITIANLTIRDVRYHAIIFNAGTDRPHVYGVLLINAGQQLLKSNPDESGAGVDNGIVEDSIFEYTSHAPSDYTNGIDIHAGAHRIVARNHFENIVSPPGTLAGPAVLAWNHASDTRVEDNTFVNCARGVAFGLVQRRDGHDHFGGTIRGNVFLRLGDQPGDAAIALADSPATQVLENAVFVSGTYRSPIELRFATTAGVLVARNVTDGVIATRDGASATLVGNLERVAPSTNRRTGR